MTILRTTLRASPGTVWHARSRGELFRAMFLTLREYNSDGLLTLLHDPDTEPLLAQCVLELNDASTFWDSPAYQDVHTWLTVLMQACAPEGHYFGARLWGPNGMEADNYGFWPLTEVYDHPPEKGALP